MAKAVGAGGPVPEARPTALLTLVVGTLMVGGCGPELQACGTGSWRPGTLELHHFAVGQADSTLVVTPDGHSLLVDLGEQAPDSEGGAWYVGQRVRSILGCSRIDQALITHFHLDHVGAVGRGGLWHLVHRQRFRIGSTWHRDAHRLVGEAGHTLRQWREYLQGEGRTALAARTVPWQETTAGSGGARRFPLPLGAAVQVALVAPGADELLAGDWSGQPAAPSENDYSLGVRLRFGKLDYFLGGDLSGRHLVGSGGGYSYHDLETGVAAAIGEVDVLRVNHHGSAHSSNATFLGQLDPAVNIVSVGQDNPHGHPSPQTLERLRSTGAVYLTGAAVAAERPGVVQVSGDVVVRSVDGASFTVGADRFEAGDPARVDADGDGYFQEVDPDDLRREVQPARSGGCDPRFQRC